MINEVHDLLYHNNNRLYSRDRKMGRNQPIYRQDGGIMQETSKDHMANPNRLALQKNNLKCDKYPALYEMLHELWQGWLYEMLCFYWREQDITPNQHINQDGYKEIWQSTRESADKGSYITGNHKVWHRNRILLHCLGLILVRRPDPNAEYLSCIERTALEYMYRSRERTGDINQRTITFLTTETWSVSMLAYSERQAQKWLDNPQPVQYLTKDSIIKVYGKELANQAYCDNRGVSEISKKAKQVIKKAIKETSKRKGYTTKEQVISKAKKSLTKTWAIKAWTIHSKVALIEIGYKYHRPTKNDKDKYGIKANSSRWIITKMLAAEILSDQAD